MRGTSRVSMQGVADRFEPGRVPREPWVVDPAGYPAAASTKSRSTT